jgi:LmbE family N-acetylglucosaminyl deacetylase
LEIARRIRECRPRIVFGTSRAGVHPAHRAFTQILVNGVFYRHLREWDQVLVATAPAKPRRTKSIACSSAICHMEPACDRFDFPVDVTEVYEQKLPVLGPPCLVSV